MKVEAVAFSPNDKYVASLGGEDDGSVVIWNVVTCEAICGAPAQVMSAGMTYTIAYANHDDDVFVTGGKYVLIYINGVFCGVFALKDCLNVCLFLAVIPCVYGDSICQIARSGLSL